MSTNLYKQALELIARDGIDYQEMAIHYAQNHPSSFVKFFREKVPASLKKFSTHDISVLYDHLGAGRKIDAIRHHRNITGSSLKEAKDVIGSLEKTVQRRN